MQHRSLLILLALLYTLQACNKKIIPKKAKETEAAVPEESLNKATEKLSINVREFDFDSFQGRATMAYQRGEKEINNIKASVRIQKDSIIWMSFSIFGITGGRVLINQDSITLIDFINRKYTVFHYPQLSQRFHFKIDYSLVQAALLGDLIQPQSAQDHIQKTADQIILEQVRENLNITNYIPIVSKKIQRVELYEPALHDSLTLVYIWDMDVQTPAPPKRSEFDLHYRNAQDQPIQQKITLEYNTFELNSDNLKFPFTIPAQYERQ